MAERTPHLDRLSDRIETVGARYPDDPVIKATVTELAQALKDLARLRTELTQQNDELERRQTELADERERWQRLFDFAPDAMVVTSRFGGILELNMRAQDLLRLGVSKRRRRLLALSLAPASRPAFQRILRNPEARGDTPIAVALDTGEPDGFRGELRCALVGADRLLWLLRDISQADRARELLESAIEKERAAAAELRAVDAMRRAFVLGVSHDLRSPIAGIAGLAHTLRTHEVDRKQQVDCLEKIEDAASKTMTLLGDLLDYEHIEAAATPAQRRRIDVAGVVESAAASVSAEGRSMTLDLDPTNAHADPRIVERIVVNLVRNAVQHTPDETRILVRCRREPDGILLSVDDDGPGIPADERRAVFDLFHRLPEPGTTGLGVGLALVKRLAQLHGGYARVEMRPGGGASFHVLLGE